MNREQFSNHAMITGNEDVKDIINSFLDKVEERGIAYFISVRNGSTKEFTLKSENNSKVIATIELRKNGIDIELHIKCTQISDINTNVLELLQKSYLS